MISINPCETQKIVDEYSEEYCYSLEAAYGSGMLSEGGETAIERMFLKDTLKNKKILDIGFGLGGAAFYLAEKYGAHLFGVEVNPWMVDEATRRTPKHLQNRVSFYKYNPEVKLPFADGFFDIVYSKGVLTHLKNKSNLFGEVNRILKSRGVFIVDDWLSSTMGRWGDRLNKMCELENLTLYAESEENYTKQLNTNNFVNIEMRDENSYYYKYNLNIVERLKKMRDSKIENTAFKEIPINDAIDSYQLIADSIRDNELLIRWFRAEKP